MSSASLQLYASRADRLLSAVKSGKAPKLPFSATPGPIASDFTCSVLRLEGSTALPPNCNSSFTYRLSLPLYSIVSNLYLSVTVDAMPTNVQATAWAPIFLFEEINMLNSEGRVVWQQRPEGAFVKIMQTWPREMRRTAMAMLGASSSDQVANAGKQTTYLVPLACDFPWNDLHSSSAAMDTRSLAPPIQIQCKIRASSDWCFASATGGDPSTGVVISNLQIKASYYDLPASALSTLVTQYMPRSVITRAWEYGQYDIAASPAGTTGSVTFTAPLTMLSGACVNFYAYIISAATGADNIQTTPLGYDNWSLTASGVTVVDKMTAQEGALEITRIYGTSPYGSDVSNSLANIVCFSFALPGFATSTNSCTGSFSFKNVVNPVFTISTSDSVTTARKLIVCSEIISLLVYSGAYGSQKVSAVSDAL